MQPEILPLIFIECDANGIRRGSVTSKYTLFTIKLRQGIGNYIFVQFLVYLAAHTPKRLTLEIHTYCQKLVMKVLLYKNLVKRQSCVLIVGRWLYHL